MDADYLHIAINHFPIIGVFIGTCLLLYGVIANDVSLKNAANTIILFTTIIIIPVYFSGAYAKSYKLLQDPQLTAEVLAHNELGIKAVWLTLILGVFSWVSLYLSLKNLTFKKTSSLITLVLAVIVLIVLAVTGAAGIAIKH